MTTSEPQALLRVGIVGDGIAARSHATALRAIGAPAVAAFAPHPDRLAAFADEMDIAVRAATLEALLACVDAVVVASPTPVHADQAAAAITAGRHVLCEIPVAPSAATARELVALADQRGVALMPAHTVRYMPAIAELQRHLADNGPVRHVIGSYTMPRVDDVGLDGHPRDWTDNLLWHHGLHVVDTALMLVGGEVVEVAATCRRKEGDGRWLDIGVLAETATGSLITVALSFQSAVRGAECLVIADHGTWRLRDWSLGDESSGRLSAGEIAAQFEKGMQRQARDFVSRATGEPGFCARDVLAAMDVLARAEAILGGRP